MNKILYITQCDEMAVNSSVVIALLYIRRHHHLVWSGQFSSAWLFHPHVMNNHVYCFSATSASPFFLHIFLFIAMQTLKLTNPMRVLTEYTPPAITALLFQLSRVLQLWKGRERKKHTHMCMCARVFYLPYRTALSGKGLQWL